MSDYTTFFFAKPSFLEGIARIFDFSGSLDRYNVSRSTREADRRALESDWRAIGEDMRRAMAEIDKELKTLGIDPPR